MQGESLLEALSRVPDPRGRQGRRYTWAALLACLLLAALNGVTSLRGMWVWVCAHASLLCPVLFWDSEKMPALNTFWVAVTRLDEESLLRVVNDWLAFWGREVISIDGKTLRGSKRGEAAALRVLTAVGQELRGVLAQVRLEGEDEVTAALRLLEQLPVAGRVVTFDAGLLERPVVKRVVEKGGAYLSPLKGNQPDLVEAVEFYLAECQTYTRPADVQQCNKGHGRIEYRELWLERCPDLGEYLAQEFDWPALRWCGRFRRRRRKIGETAWSEEEGLWVAGGALEHLEAAQALQWLRQHWVIENNVFRVRDVTGDEDRLHGRKIGPALSVLRSLEINFARQLGYRYLPDTQRALAARPDRGLSLLVEQRDC